MNRKQIKRIRNTLRKIASQIVRDEVLRLNKCTIRMKGKDGRWRNYVHHPCSICKEMFRPDAVEIDHIDEVGRFVIEGPIRNTKYGDCRVLNWQEWMDRLLCSLDNFQILCVECHQRKTLGFNEHLRYGGDLL